MIRITIHCTPVETGHDVVMYSSNIEDLLSIGDKIGSGLVSQQARQCLIKGMVSSRIDVRLVKCMTPYWSGVLQLFNVPLLFYGGGRYVDTCKNANRTKRLSSTHHSSITHFWLIINDHWIYRTAPIDSKFDIFFCCCCWCCSRIQFDIVAMWF